MTKTFVNFILVADSEEPIEISVDLDSIESIVDGKAVKTPDVTQINMKSGLKFFVKEKYTKVKEDLSKLT